MQHTLKWALVLMIGLALAVTLAGCAREIPARSVFTVEGMHCDGCSTSITAALKAVDGVEEASADHEEGVAEAVYRPGKVDVEELKTEIEKLGYTVTGTETAGVEG